MSVHLNAQGIARRWRRPMLVALIALFVMLSGTGRGVLTQTVDVDEWFATASRAFAAERFRDAGTAFARVIAADKHNVPALIGRGNAYLALSDYEHALDDYDDAIHAGGAYPDAYLARGTLRWLQGQLGRAEDDFRKAVSLAPDDEFYYARLATVLTERRKTDDVYKVYQHAYDEDSRRNWALWGSLGTLAGERKWEELRLAINRILPADAPTRAAVAYYAGMYKANFDDHASVVEWLEKALAADADHLPLDVYAILAKAHAALGNDEAFKKNLLEYYDRTGLDMPGLAMSNVPKDAARFLRELTIDVHNIRSVSVSVDGDYWAVTYDVNGWRARAPAAFNDRLRDLSNANRNIEQVAFAPGGGWIIVAGGSYWASGIPSTMEAKLRERTAAGDRIDWVAFATNGWLIHCNSRQTYYLGLSSRAVQAINDVYKTADLRGISFGTGERFVLRTNRGATSWYTSTGMATYLQTLADDKSEWTLAEHAGDSGWVVYSLDLARKGREFFPRHRH